MIGQKLKGALKLKLISWNCKNGMNSIEKFNKILELSPDLAIIQESYHPNEFLVDMDVKQFIWTGTEKVRGLGLAVLSFSVDYQLTLLVDQLKYEWVVPIIVSGKEDFTLIAVWTKRMPGYSYGKLLYAALKEYEHLLQDGPVVMIGDFNFDKRVASSYTGVGFQKVIDLFNRYNLKSCYHTMSGEEFGAESQATYYHHRKLDRPFHIDYCLVSRDILPYIEHFTLGNVTNYLVLSDHMPIAIEFTLEKKSVEAVDLNAMSVE